MVVVGLQVTIMPHISLLAGHPDLVLVGLVLWTAVAGREAALLPALLIAPLLDAMSGLPIGASVLPLLLVVVLAGYGERMLFGGQLGWPVFVSFIATLLTSLLLYLELTLLGWQIAWLPVFLEAVLPAALLNSLLCFILYVPLLSLRRRPQLTM